MSQTTSDYAKITHDEYPKSINGKWYSDDDISNLLLEHYSKFKQSLKQEKKALFEKNLNKAKEAVEQFYIFLLKKYKIRLRSIHLKYVSINKFEALVVMPEKDYLSESYDVSYWASLGVTKYYNDSDFEISFNFMPASRRINHDALMGDGFLLTYKDVKK